MSWLRKRATTVEDPSAFEVLAREASDSLDSGRLTRVIEVLERIGSSHPEHAMLVAFQLGVVYQQCVGDGERARGAYEAVPGAGDTVEHLAPQAAVDRLKANALENLMLLSLSYEQYEANAARLEALDPSAPIVLSQRRQVRELYEKGQSWSDVMLWIAGGYGVGTDSEERAGPGFGASLYHLMLRHRRDLRLSRELSIVAASLYAENTRVLGGIAARQAERGGGRPAPEDLALILDSALPLLEECAAAYPDERVREPLERLQGIRQRLASGEAGPDRSPAGRPGRAVSWQTSGPLARAVTATGTEGLRFQLFAASVVEGELSLTFRSLSHVPSGREEDCGLFLRCTVGLTMPRIVEATGDVNAYHGVEYSVKLGDGVPMDALVLRCGEDQVGPLQVTSDEDDQGWHVRLKPMAVIASRMQEQYEAQDRVFRRLVPAFEQLQAEPVVVAGR